MSWAMWITGIPGSGKSVLARAAAAELRSLGEPAAVLELDEIRRVLTPEPRYTDAEREVVYRALVHMARLLSETGVGVIIDATAHRRAWRALARGLIRRFAEVQLVCPLEVCEERERRRTSGHAPRGVYAAARRPGATVPGVDVPYEPALQPEVVVDTATEDVATAVGKVVATARRLVAARRRAPLAARPAWAILISGAPEPAAARIARSAAAALARRGVRVKVLEASGIRRDIMPHGATEAEDDVAARAVPYMAKLLTDAGVPVIVDAGGPRPVPATLSRALLPRMAEVRLASRLDAAGSHRGTRATRDLTVQLDTADTWKAIQEVLFLARRLDRMAARTPVRERRPTCKSES